MSRQLRGEAVLTPDELIGQKVWIEVPRDPDFPDLEPYRVKAEITQPTSPPWFYARYENPPVMVREGGKWLSLLEAQQAYLYAPVLDDLYDEIEEDEIDFEDELSIH